MTIDTYAKLKDAVANFSERGDMTKFIPDLIGMAEARISRTLDHPFMSGRATSTVVTTSSEPQFVDLPTDFQAMRRLYLSGVTGQPIIEYLTEGQLAREKNRTGGARSRPTKYTIFGSELELLPIPDSAYVLEMVYRKRLPILSDTVQSNWLLSLSPDIYLYGSLYQAAQFTGEQDKIARWDSCYNTAYDDLTHHGRNMKYGNQPRVMVAGENTP